MIIAIPIMKVLTLLVNTLSFGSTGGLFINSGSDGSTPRAIAGRPSVTKLTQSR